MGMTEALKLDCWPDHADCEHRKYVGRAVTLNGQPAKVVKDDEGYAHVTPLDPTCGPVSYSWVAVFCKCDLHDGRFGE